MKGGVINQLSEKPGGKKPTPAQGPLGPKYHGIEPMAVSDHHGTFDSDRFTDVSLEKFKHRRNGFLNIDSTFSLTQNVSFLHDLQVHHFAGNRRKKSQSHEFQGAGSESSHS